MKKLLSVLMVVCVVFVSSPSDNLAQFHLKLGPATGMNFNIATGSDVKETTNGFGFFIGGRVDMSFSPVVGLITGLQFYDNRSVSSSQSGTVQGISYTLDNSFSLAYFVLEPLFKLTVPRSMFYFFVGPSIGINMEGSFESTISSANDQVTFQDGSKKYKETMKDLNARFELKIGSGMDIPIGSSMTISPELSFGYGLTKVKSDVSSRIMSIQALVALKFGLI